MAVPVYFELVQVGEVDEQWVQSGRDVFGPKL